MDTEQEQRELLASVAAVQCLQGFLRLEHALRNAVLTALRIEGIRGNRDNASYWSKQHDVLKRMGTQARTALDTLEEDALEVVGLAAESAHRELALDNARECFDDIITHYGDFLEACNKETHLKVMPFAEKMFANGLPDTNNTVVAIKRLKALAEAVTTASPLFRLKATAVTA
jgi:hypothetical protein